MVGEGKGDRCFLWLVLNFKQHLVAKVLIVWKNDTSYHISSHSIGILKHNDVGLRGKKNKNHRT